MFPSKKVNKFGISVLKRLSSLIVMFAMLISCSSQDDTKNNEIEKKGGGTGASQSKTISSSGTTDLINEGLIAYFPFDGSAVDKSDNDHNTTVSGATLSTDRTSSNRKAYRFDGVDDYILCKDSDALHPKLITVASWVYPEAYGIMAILGKTTYANAQGEQYGLSLKELTPTFSIKRNSGGALGVGWEQVNSSSAIPINQWSHLTATWDGIALKIYVDGQLKKQNIEVPAGPIDNLTGGNLQIGRWLERKPFHYAGKIDEIRIYNRALSSFEIATLYNLEKQSK